MQVNKYNLRISAFYFGTIRLIELTIKQKTKVEILIDISPGSTQLLEQKYVINSLR